MSVCTSTAIGPNPQIRETPSSRRGVLVGRNAARASKPPNIYPVAMDVELWPELPGSELILAGLADLQDGRHTAEALLVSIGAPRLRRSGVEIPTELPDPEHGLYELLAAEGPDSAHSRYNALIRRLVSFERALECAA